MHGSTLIPSAKPNAVISAAQCRSARALLGWPIAKLASVASVSGSAIDDFETERREPVPAVARPIRRAFEAVGIMFLPGDGVRLRRGPLSEGGGDSAKVGKISDAVRPTVGALMVASGQRVGNRVIFRQRRAATNAQIASTSPNGQAP
jgi:hypothetical protein